jgi:hypothetical protein
MHFEEIRVLVIGRRTREKIPLGRSISRWVDNNKMNPIEIVWSGVE